MLSKRFLTPSKRRSQTSDPPDRRPGLPTQPICIIIFLKEDFFGFMGICIGLRSCILARWQKDGFPIHGIPWVKHYLFINSRTGFPGTIIYFLSMYSSSDTGPSHTTLPFPIFGLMAIWVRALSGAAPCQCSVSGGIFTISPFRIRRAARPFS